MRRRLYYKDIIQIMIMVAICIVPFVITPGFHDVTQLAKIIAIHLIVFIILVIWIASEKNKIGFMKENSEPLLLLVIYFILLFISTINAYKIEYAIFGSPRWWEGMITLSTYMLLTLFAGSYLDLSSRKVDLMIVSSTLISLYGILQYFGLYFVSFPEEFISREYVLSTIGNPNFLGSFIVLFIPLVMYSFMKYRRKIYLVSFSMMYLCLLMTNTRSAWLGLIASIVVFYCYLKKYNRFIKELMILSSTMIIITVLFDVSSGGLFIQRFLTIIKDFMSIVEKEQNYNRAGSSRIFIWERVTKLVIKKPMFGHGLDNLGLVFDEYFQKDVISTLGKRVWINKAHNEYLHIVVSTGIPSLLVYLCFVINIMKKGFKSLKKDMDILPIYSAVVGYLVQAFFNISVVSVAYIYWIYLGILMHNKNYKGEV